LNKRELFLTSPSANYMAVVGLGSPVLTCFINKRKKAQNPNALEFWAFTYS